jgi:hypothetical protein
MRDYLPFVFLFSDVLLFLLLHPDIYGNSPLPWYPFPPPFLFPFSPFPFLTPPTIGACSPQFSLEAGGSNLGTALRSVESVESSPRRLYYYDRDKKIIM